MTLLRLLVGDMTLLLLLVGVLLLLLLLLLFEMMFDLAFLLKMTTTTTMNDLVAPGAVIVAFVEFPIYYTPPIIPVENDANGESIEDDENYYYCDDDA
eukprot:CAMPEP_0170819686 /NCGR_PEP_ID=MMETSP0733-20121128/41788_1 /TAXON_ID=186038 /ORGANISM="Fragilariopsis kerguelensis, Strain L26-C5" /LENGTH=97 /DNA_ID=CAMNT_0011180655 /DNA_START=251 /DNA_END=545 /DNA_ORIENTATION=-